jgi:hypothetical protein
MSAAVENNSTVPLTDSIDKAGFILLPSLDDGNCMYHTINHWMRLIGHPLQGKDHLGLRKLVIDHMKKRNSEDPNLFGAFFINNDYPSPAAKKKDIENEISKLEDEGVWDSPISDHVPLMVAEKFNLHMKLWNWSWATRKFETVYDINPGGRYNINIVRLNDNHFELMFPKESFTNNTKKLWNTIEEEDKSTLIAKLSALRINYEKRLGREIVNNNEFERMRIANNVGELNTLIKLNKQSRATAAKQERAKAAAEARKAKAVAAAVARAERNAEKAAKATVSVVVPAATTRRVTRSQLRKRSRSSSRSSTKHQGGSRRNAKNISRFTRLIGKRVTRKNLKGIRELEEENMLTNSLISLNKIKKSRKRLMSSRRN